MTAMDPTTGAVVITTKDIYDKLVDVEKVMSTMAPQGQQLLDHETRLRTTEACIPKDLEVRLRSLEKWKWGLPPTALTAAYAIAQALLGHRG